MKPTIRWNDQVKVIISDVDETIADLYVDACPAMVREVASLLKEEKALFLVSGQSIGNIQRRIINKIEPELRRRLIVGHCSGAEVWGFDESGRLLEKPYYTQYDTSLTDRQKKKWRELIGRIIAEFRLEVFPTMPIAEFKLKSENNPLAIMVEDRGPQITFEVVNGYDLTPQQLVTLDYGVPRNAGSFDLRIPILKRAEELLKDDCIPVTPRLAGVFAIDFAIEGVSKTTAVNYVAHSDVVLCRLGLTRKDIENPRHVEVWGDKFSAARGGTDRHISEALPKEVRSISFREEHTAEFPEGYNIVVWDGHESLHHGLLEYLRTRRPNAP